jgi:multiple sugar transport system substrate-binding protein
VVDEFGFTEETGIPIKLESASSAMEDIAKLTTYFRSGTSPYDVLMASDEMFGGFVRAGWFEPLDDALPQGFWDDFPASMDDMIANWHKYEGKTYRVPHEFAFSLFWYRQDWFNQLGVEPPSSWDEIVEIGTRLKDEYPNRYMFGDALGKDGYLYVYIALMTIQAGGNPFEADEGFRKALKFTHDMIYEHEVFPKSALNKTYDQINQDYMNDRIAILRQWPYFHSATRGNDSWYEEGKAEVMLPPEGPANNKVWVGGHGWSVPKHSENIENAKEFITFITKPEVATRMAELNSFFMVPRKSTMKELGDQEFAGFLKKYSDAGVFASRPFHPKISEAQTAVEDAAHAYLSNQMSLDEAVDFCKSKLEDLK